MAQDRKEEKRKYYLKNKEKILEQQRRYKETHKEEDKEYRKKYYDDRREELIEGSKKYNEQNKDVLHVSQKLWREKTKESRKEKRKKNREESKRRFFEMYGGKCNCPGCKEDNPEFYTLDHVQNNGTENGKRKDGTTEYNRAIKEYRPDIYQVLCFNCNLGRSKHQGVCPHSKA